MSWSPTDILVLWGQATCFGRKLMVPGISHSSEGAVRQCRLFLLDQCRMKPRLRAPWRERVKRGNTSRFHWSPQRIPTNRHYFFSWRFHSHKWVNKPFHVKMIATSCIACGLIVLPNQQHRNLTFFRELGGTSFYKELLRNLQKRIGSNWSNF